MGKIDHNDIDHNNIDQNRNDDAEGKAAQLVIEIDRLACRGSGECALRAERTFALDDDDRAVLRTTQVNDTGSPDAGDDVDSEQVVLAAARACPVFAISVTRGGIQLV